MRKKRRREQARYAEHEHRASRIAHHVRAIAAGLVELGRLEVRKANTGGCAMFELVSIERFVSRTTSSAQEPTRRKQPDTDGSDDERSVKRHPFIRRHASAIARHACPPNDVAFSRADFEASAATPG